MITTLMPETHYSRYLIEALCKNDRNKMSLFIYANKEEKIKAFDNINIKFNKCWSQNFFYPFQIARHAIKDKVDMVHLQHEINMYGGMLTAILFPFLVVLLKITGIKVIVTIHAIVPKNEIDINLLETFSWPKNRILSIIVGLVLSYIYAATCSFSDTLIVHSEYLKSVLITDYRAKKDKILVIPHGVPMQNDSTDLNEINAFWWDKINSNKIILNFGYVVRRKGLEYLIDAFEGVSKKYDDYVLVITGGTLKGHEEYVESLKIIIGEKGLSDRIIFTSFVKETELRNLFMMSEFVVLPALYSISASGPLAQAISYHKPTIGTNIGVFREEVNDGVNGILCLPRDSKSLEKAILNLIENPVLLQKMSENMKKKAEVRSWHNIAIRTFSVYENLMQSSMEEVNG